MDDRATYLAWCKQRALEYLERGDHVNALASFVSDVRKEESTADIADHPMMGQFVLIATMASDPVAETRRMIEGWA